MQEVQNPTMPNRETAGRIAVTASWAEGGDLGGRLTVVWRRAELEGKAPGAGFFAGLKSGVGWPAGMPGAAAQGYLTAPSVLDLLFPLSPLRCRRQRTPGRREALQRIRSATLDAGLESKGAFQEAALWMTL